MGEFGEFSAKLESDLNQHGARQAGKTRKQRYIVYKDGFWAIPVFSINGSWQCALDTSDDGVIIREVAECDPDYTENIDISESELNKIKQTILQHGFSIPIGTRKENLPKIT